MPSCLIKQPAGLGDIIFCQKIADLCIQNKHDVWWPIIDAYYDDVKKYLGRDGINYCRESEDFPLREYYFSQFTQPCVETETKNIYLPLQHADIMFPNDSILKSKYKMAGLTCDDWANFVELHRDKDKEERLYSDILKLEPSEEYSLVNCWYGSLPTPLKKEMNITGDHRVVEMRVIDEYSIFDWAGVIEKASAIYSVDTVINYIIEKVNPKAEKYELYSRYSPANWSHIDGLFSTPWNYND